MTITDRLKNMAIGAIIFLVAGHTITDYLPSVYYRFVDSSVYYYFGRFENEALIRTDQLITSKDKYSSCDYAELTGARYANFSGTLDSVRQLMFIKSVDGEKPTNLFIDSVVAKATVSKSDGQLVGVVVKLPCDLQPGNYYYQGEVSFVVHDVPKTYNWTSNIFTITP